MVLLTFTVADHHGKRVPGIRPQDVQVFEDGREQKIHTFIEQTGKSAQSPSQVEEVPNNVFILFDTSNCMYEGFAQAEDAIARFIRGLNAADSVAVYTFSGSLFRAARLTRDHEAAIGQMRQAVSGDETALYDGLLLTLRDAAKVPGRKSVVVFSNGPDTKSMLAPEHVARVAEDEGIPIYMISTREPTAALADALRLLTGDTGGRSYVARLRQEQDRAFAEVHDELMTAYLVTYMPGPNLNEGYRKIEVRVNGTTYQIHTRAGYTPHPVMPSTYSAGME